MERTTNMSVTPLFIELLGDAYGDWICLDYRMQQRVERLDAIQVAPHQPCAGQLTRSHCGLKLGDCRLNKLEIPRS